jgi:uncharacterized hydrophobic protein (TIGR00341 family)
VRELHVQIPEGDRESITALLDDRGIDYTTLTDDGKIHFFVPLPTAAVSAVLEDLQDADVDTESYTVLTKANFVDTPRLTELRERYRSSVRKLPKQELHGKIRSMQWPYQLYYLGTILSVVAATAGLLLDQPALLIGSMIIAPQASSALAAPAGALLGDWDLFTTSIKEQILGLGIAVVGAALFAWLVKRGGFVPSNLPITQVELVSLRLAPTLLSTIGAIIAGIVGAFGYTTEQSTALIGVMIAAALIPAAAAIGLGIAWTAPLFGLGALLLLLVNVLAINIGAFVTLLGMGYRPAWQSGGSFRQSVPSEYRTFVYAAFVLILVSAVATGYLTATSVAFSQQVNQEVEATLSNPAYANLSLTGVQVGYGGRSWESSSTNVTVQVSRPSNREFPDIGPRIERQIEQRTGQDVRVTVKVTESQTANSSRPRAGSLGFSTQSRPA